MKLTKIITGMIISIIIISCSCYVYAEDDTIEKYGKEVCSWITDTEENKEIKALEKQGKYKEAIELYKEKFLEYCKSMKDSGLYDVRYNRNTTYADALMSDVEDVAYPIDHLGKAYPYVLGTIGNYDWDNKIITTDNSSGLVQEFSSFGWIKPLVAEYLATGNKAYMDKFFAILRDFDEKFVANDVRYSAYIKSAPNPVSRYIDPLPINLRWSTRLYAIILMADYNMEETKSSLDTASFIHMLRAFKAQNQVAYIRINVANQMLSGISAAVYKYILFQDLQYEIDYLPYIGETFDIYLKKSYLPDGQDSEMSFNYNWGFIRNISSIAEVSKYLKNKVVWIEQAKNLMQNRYVSMVSLTTPTKMLPNTGHYWSNNDNLADIKLYGEMLEENNETVDRIVSNIYGDSSLKEPAFTSIAFPYAGYYVMRDGWKNDSQYIYFKSGRMTNTHYELSCLSLIYDAFGERLLIDAGPVSYQPETQQIKSHLMSTFAHNTVSVEQQSQVVHRGTDLPDMQKINDALWYTSDNFDFVKDDYINGYGKEVMNLWDQIKDTTDVVHERYIINDRENTLTLVVDDMITQSAYGYEQNWNFAYKFADYGSVICDADEKYIKTNLNDGKAGIELYSITADDVTYEINSGEMNPNRGWYQEYYGVDYFPGMHVQSKWYGKKNSSIATLINPTDKGISQIKNRETFADGNGLKLILNNGNIIYILSSSSNDNELKLGALSLCGKTLYAVQHPNGTINGMAYGVSDISYNSNKISFENNKFEFKINGNEFKIINTVKAPKSFKWVESEDGMTPDYGFNTDEKKFIY